jgi:hypothetical protein
VYFLVRLRYTKSPTEYTGPESYVNKKMEDQSIDYFPINQAFVLKEREKMEDSEKAKLAEDVEKTKAAIQVRVTLN